MEILDSNKADMRNQYGVFERFSSMPQGFRPPTVWLLAPSDGSISSFEEAVGGATAEMSIVNAQEMTVAVEGGAVVSVVASGVAFLTLASEGGAEANGSVAAVGSVIVAVEGGAVTSFSTLATLPIVMTTEGGAVASLNPTKIVFIDGASLTDGSLSVTTIADGVWAHSSGKFVKNNAGLVPALL